LLISYRKYPAGGGINVRKSYKETQMKGYDIPANTNFVTSTVGSQNDPRYWDHPEEFNPDRWNNASVPIPGSWTVFGDGQRGCAGRQFALLAGMYNTR
jgi:cytochrome P450